MNRYVKKSLHFLKYFVISGFIIITLEILVGYWLISTRWKLFVSNSEMRAFAEEVNNAEAIPESFKEVYSTLYPNHINSSMTRQLFFNYGFKYIFRRKRKELHPYCYCSAVSDIQEKQNKKAEEIVWDTRTRELEYGFGIVKYSSSEKCFDYVIRYRLDLLKRNADPEYYRFFLEKDLGNLTEEEILEVIILLHFNPKLNRDKYPEAYYRELDQLKSRLHEARL